MLLPPPKWIASRSIFDLPVKERRLKELELILAKPDFWDDAEKATLLLKERTHLADLMDTCQQIYQDIEDAQIFFELASEEDDAQSQKEAQDLILKIEKQIKAFSLDITLSQEDDQRDALMSITAGAGGTDSQDWAEMLFRMYTRWIDKRGFSMQLIDFQPGDEAGIKGVTMRVAGKNCYGFMKVESGAHHPSAHRGCGAMPAGILPAQEPGNRHEGAQIQTVPD